MLKNVCNLGIILASVRKYSGYIMNNKNKEQNIELLELKHMGVTRAKLEREKKSNPTWPNWPRVPRPQTKVFMTNKCAPSFVHSMGTIYQGPNYKAPTQLCVTLITTL